MMTYSFLCQGVQVLDDSICLATDKFLLDQNCDYLEICKNELKFWYDDSTALAVYSGFKRVCLIIKKCKYTLSFCLKI